MPEETNRKSAADQPLYVILVLFVVLGISAVTWLAPSGFYVWKYGIPKLSDWMAMPVFDYSTALLKNGDIWYEVTKIGPTISNTGNLAHFNPEVGQLEETTISVPFPLTGLVVRGDQLWAVAPGTVVCVEGDERVEFTPKRLLKGPCEPFLFEGKIAVIEMAARPHPTLLLFEEGEWKEVGEVNLPFGFSAATVDGMIVLSPAPAPSKIGSSLLDVQVLAHDGRLWVFVSDGSVIACREGLEIMAASALAPANSESIVDLSELSEWKAVCRFSPRRGTAAKWWWKVAQLVGDPVVITGSVTGPSPFSACLLNAARYKAGKWTAMAEKKIPAALKLMVASDGQAVYAAGQSFTQTLRINRLTEAGFQETGVFLKAPVSPVQQPAEKWGQIYQWAYWPGLLVLGLSVSWLMKVFLGSSYQFGASTVELASVTRRMLARVIDMLGIWLSLYGILVVNGISNQEQVAENMDRLFSGGFDGIVMYGIWLLLEAVSVFALFTLTYSILQVRWGITPGKWICGIRTIRTTLRPCGFFRALLREWMLAVETLLGMTVIPFVLLLAYTSNRQRLGDMVADTIVIRKKRGQTQP